MNRTLFWNNTPNSVFLHKILDTRRLEEIIREKSRIRIVYLDLQQVLTTDTYSRRLLQKAPAMKTDSAWVGDEIFDPVTVMYLNRLLLKTGAYIIITSSLREPPCTYGHPYYEYIRAFCKERGLMDRIVGITPSFAPDRQKEIGYIQKNAFGYDNETGSVWLGSPLRSNVIIDDCVLSGGRRNIFVKCERQRGFRLQQYRQALAILRRDLPV